jgi:hypothetical protein
VGCITSIYLLDYYREFQKKVKAGGLRYLMVRNVHLSGSDPKRKKLWSGIFISALLVFCLAISAGCMPVTANGESSSIQSSDVNDA